MEDELAWSADNSRRGVGLPEKRVGLGKTERKHCFGESNPADAQVGWDRGRHLGVCVLRFGRALAGVRHAQALDYSLLKKDHGFRDYDGMCQKRYGLLAREDDFHGRRRFKQGGGRLLRNVCAMLKDIEMFGDKTSRMHGVQLRRLSESGRDRGRE